MSNPGVGKYLHIVHYISSGYPEQDKLNSHGEKIGTKFTFSTRKEDEYFFDISNGKKVDFVAENVEVNGRKI